VERSGFKLFKETEIFNEILRVNVHDLKNYLSSVILYAEFLENPKEVDESREVILKKADSLNLHLDALKLLYSNSSWFEGNSLETLSKRLSLIVTPLFKSKSKLFLLRYTKEELPKEIKNIKKDVELLFKEFYRFSQLMESDCLLTIIRSVNKNLCFYFIERNDDLSENFEAVKEISFEEADKTIKNCKTASIVKFEGGEENDV
jgi:hypothetical protein